MTRPFSKSVTCFVFACSAWPALLTLSPMAEAQEGRATSPASEQQGFLDSMERWFNEQAAKFNSTLKDTQKKIENFGDDAGHVAKSTAQGAKNAADTVVGLPNTRVVSGHQRCEIAVNGAPDCAAAAETLCKAHGFKSGRSLDMTRAESCPPKVYLSGRSSGPECKTETFVSRVVCQ